jgi:hypothetical protein
VCAYHEPQHDKACAHHGEEDRVGGVHTDAGELTVQVIVDLHRHTRQ